MNFRRDITQPSMIAKPASVQLPPVPRSMKNIAI